MDNRMRKRSDPPRLAEWLFRKFLRKDDRFHRLGDFEEVFQTLVESEGRFRAWRWYWWQVMRSLPEMIKHSMFCGGSMFKHYAKIALRLIQRHKGYSFINIAGLSVGMACCLLIVLYIQDELSYDAFHVNADRLFRVVTSTSQDGIPTNAISAFGIGPALKQDFPEVVDYVRLRMMGQDTRIYICHGDRKFYEERFFFADPHIFTMFTFPLLQGFGKNALSEPNSIVITEAMAKKYFGDEDPMGKILEVDPYNTGEMMMLHVTGIAENVPGNSHFHFDFLTSYVNQKEDVTRFDGLPLNYTYVLLKDASQAVELESRLLDFVHRHFREDSWYTNHLQPIRKIRLHSHVRSEIEPTGTMASVNIFSFVAVIVLIIACINYINLSTARSLKRAREVGLRKVVGARRKQLIGQFLGESLLISLLSGFFALFLAALFIPLFNNITDKGVTLHFLAGVIPLVSLLGIIVVVGIVSGSYVAFLLSGLTPLQVWKSLSYSDGWKRKLREGMVIFQFFLATIMIVGTITAYKQMRFIQTHNTGYHRDEILAIPLNQEARGFYTVLRSELLKCDAIRNTTTSSHVPTRGTLHDPASFEGAEYNLTPVFYFIDKEFVDTYGVQILSGTDFTREIHNTSNAEYLVSEQAVAEAGYPSPQEALGKRIQWRSRRGENNGFIAGVIHDMNLYSFHRAAYPMILQITPIQQHHYLSVRLDANRYGEALTAIRSAWEQLVPDYPLDYFFLDESFEALHRADRRLGDIFRYFSATAVFVACLGLFGLAVFTAEQKTKEIGIRKTLGAPIISIYLLLSKSFVKWVLLANVIAWPVAFFMMRRWLDNFVYRTRLDFWIFLASGLASLTVALLTVSWQSIKAARTRPVESLKYE